MGAAEGGAEGGESDGVVAMSFVFQLRVCDAHSIMIAVVHVVFSIFERAIVSVPAGWVVSDCLSDCRTVGLLSDYCRKPLSDCRTRAQPDTCRALTSEHEYAMRIPA